MSIDPRLIEPTTEELKAAMLQIKALDGEAHIEFSEWTGQWYMRARIDVSDGACLTSLGDHRATPAEAVWAFYCALCQVDLHDFAHVLVTRAGHDDRRHWRWNGATFKEEQLDRLAVRLG